MKYLGYIDWRAVMAVAVVLVAYLLACFGLWRFQANMIFFPPQVVGSTPADVNLSYEELYLTVGEGHVHGWWIPAPKTTTNAPVIVYAHGNASNLSDLVFRFQQFHDWGYAVMAIDYRGYGESSGPFPSEQRVYEDIEAAWQYLTQQRQIAADRIVLYGQSIGGAIALNLAVAHPEAAGLIMESSFTSMRDMVDYRFPLLPKVMPIDWILTQQFDSIEKLRSLQLPLLLIHGTADNIVPVTMSQQLYDETVSARKATSHLILIEAGNHNSLPTIGGNAYAGSIQLFVEAIR